MERCAISFDIDGVIAGGNYTPRWDRNPTYYSTCPLVDPLAPLIINELTQFYDIYFISSRAYHNANLNTREWLQAQGVNLAHIAGVITACSPPNKKAAIDITGSSTHVDDDPRVIDILDPSIAVLFDSPQWEANKDYYYNPRIKGWKELAYYLWPLSQPMTIPFV